MYGITEMYDCCYDIKTWKEAEKATSDELELPDINGKDNKSFEPEATKEDL